MLKYVCLWKLKDDAGEEGSKLVRQYLNELPRRVGWVRSWVWGEALGTVGEPFTHGFTAEFDHLEGLEGYLSHRDRLAIEKRIAPYVAGSLAGYYETPPQAWKVGAGAFRQISMLKVKADAPPGKVDEIAEELANLGMVVPEVKRRHVVRIFDNPDVDVMFMWEFESREAHQRYSRHPFHGPMDQRIRPFFEKSTGIRYDLEPEGDSARPRTVRRPVGIRYVALMKVRGDTPPDKLKEIEVQLRVLGETIAEVASWSSGRCRGSPGSPTGFSFVVVADFEDEKAYQRYKVHPQHQAFRQFMAPYREKSVGMHYAANYPGLFWIKYEGGVPVPIPAAPGGTIPLGYRDLPPLEDQQPIR